MSDRTFRRAAARRQYDKFSKAWREEARLAGRYGKPHTSKPRFGAWWAMHERQVELMKKSTPEDVRTYLGAGTDPWGEPVVELKTDPPTHAEGERGVMTIDIAGNDD